jgi:ribosomal protein S21
MPVEVKRKSNENTFGLLSRFKDKVRKGRILSLTKQNSYFQKPKNKLQKKKDALRRINKTAKRDFLIKTGQMEEEDKWKKNKR